MNEKNYEQDLDFFRENFIKIKDIVKETMGETEFIKIENGIFKSLYDEAFIEIKNMIDDLENDIILTVPKIYIEKSNIPENKEIRILKKKCAVFGGWRPH